jgi:hypothetical protein
MIHGNLPLPWNESWNAVMRHCFTQGKVPIWFQRIPLASKAAAAEFATIGYDRL